MSFNTNASHIALAFRDKLPRKNLIILSLSPFANNSDIYSEYDNINYGLERRRHNSRDRNFPCSNHAETLPLSSKYLLLPKENSNYAREERITSHLRARLKFLRYKSRVTKQ